MTAPTHAVLIRGINVGGKSAVPMARLREVLTESGFDGVRTYIQSGNVVVAAPRHSEAQVTATVEALLEREFSVATPVVTLGADSFRAVVAQAPRGFGADTEVFKHDVVYLRDILDAQETLAAVRLKDGVDEAWAGERALYFRRVSSRITGSYMNKIVAMPQYKHMTIRNWRTTLAVEALLASD